MSYETLTFDQTDATATITLNRPDDANALTGLMARELFDVAMRCDTDQSIRAAILTGTGKMFCAGGDLKDFNARGPDLPAYLTETATVLHNAIIRFQMMDAPLVVAVNGTAAGAGLSMALAGDYVLASDSARFVLAYTASGLTPDGSSTYFLAKHVGLLRAKELALTNRVLGADEAVQWGLATRMVAPDALAEEAQTLAAGFAAGPSRAFGATKRLLLTGFSASIEAQLEAETRAIVAMSRTHDGRHGIDAFATKQKPAFTGS
ncbi:MAG: enoyl-CoA hydratase-related protein [Pseudomonadota bacterium]